MQYAYVIKIIGIMQYAYIKTTPNGIVCHEKKRFRIQKMQHTTASYHIINTFAIQYAIACH